jgi:hypothetical protein
MLAAWWNAKFLWIFSVWQIPLVILLVALILFWRHMRNKQV